MLRFFSPSQNITHDKITVLDKAQLHHIKNVLCLRAGSKVVIFDERGSEYIARIEKISSKDAILIISDKHDIVASRRLKITVACAIPKKSKMDDIVDRLTQLGVDRIIPLKTQRVVIKLDKHKEIARRERWKKIAFSAALQSQRNTLTVIEPRKRLEEVLSESGDFDLKLISTLSGERKSLKEVLGGFRPKNILVLIGPEGDFSEEEVKEAKRAGCIPLSLGKLVLRVETAAVAAASFIRLYENN